MPESAKANLELGIISKVSHRSVSHTVARLTELIEAKDLKLFSVIDQRAEALEVGLELRDTTLVIFGSPLQGTPVMDAEPLAALDLPLKVLVWDDKGTTRVTYYSPDSIATRFGLGSGIAGNFAGLNPLTDALVEL
jgi:uncharacterized protein (DUF302 family)